MAPRTRTVLQWTFIIAFYAYLLVETYPQGSWTFYLLLAQIPFFFLCWGLSIALAGSRIRDISKHLTDSEREEVNRMAASFGARCGLVVVPFAILCGVGYGFAGVDSTWPYLILIGLFLVLITPLGMAHRSRLKAFMESTEYGKTVSGRA